MFFPRLEYIYLSVSTTRGARRLYIYTHGRINCLLRRGVGYNNPRARKGKNSIRRGDHVRASRETDIYIICAHARAAYNKTRTFENIMTYSGDGEDKYTYTCVIDLERGFGLRTGL